MRILSFLMSNGPSTYTEDAITVMSGGVWWRMKQEVPQGFLSRTYETPLAAQNCWCLQIHENFTVLERCYMSSSFVVSYDPIIHVQKKLYTRITELEHFTNTLWRVTKIQHLWQRNMLDSEWWQNSDMIWTYHSYIIFAQYIKCWSSQNLRLTTACWKTVTQLLFLNSKIICTFFQQNLDQNYKHCLKQWYKVNTLSDVWAKHLWSHSEQYITIEAWVMKEKEH